MRVISGVILAIISLSVLGFNEVGAVNSLKIQPLLYEDKLEPGEVKKGFVDISNPMSQTVKVETSVQAFRQIDDEGNLEFFDSEEIEQGLKLDFDKFTLEPRGAMRLYFVLDGSKLPTGDVFATIFATARPSQDGNIQQAVRVGTLFIIENGTPGAREASITGLDAPFWQPGSQINGSYSIKNDAKAGQATGFKPDVEVTLTPLGGKFSHQASLIFAGRERVNELSIDTQRAGLYFMRVSYGDSSVGRWILLTPLWSVFVAALVIVGGVALAKYRTKAKKIYKKSKK